MRTDRRRAIRLHPKKDIQVIFDCTGPVMGRVCDISALGLSAQYEGSCRLDLFREIVVSIVIGDDAEVIGDLRCVPVYNIPTLAEGRSFRGNDIHLLGLAFKKMKAHPLSRLDRLLAGLA